MAIPDPVLNNIGDLLGSEAADPMLGSAMMVDSIVRALAVHLLRKHSNLTGTVLSSQPMLTSRRFDRVVEYMRDHINRPISRKSQLHGVTVMPGRTEIGVFRQIRHDGSVEIPDQAAIPGDPDQQRDDTLGHGITAVPRGPVKLKLLRIDVVTFVDEHAVSNDDDRVHIGERAAGDAGVHRAQQRLAHSLCFRRRHRPAVVDIGRNAAAGCGFGCEHGLSSDRTRSCGTQARDGTQANNESAPRPHHVSPQPVLPDAPRAIAFVYVGRFEQTCFQPFRS